MRILAAVLLVLVTAAPAWAADVAGGATHHAARVVLDPAQGRFAATDNVTLTGGGPTVFRLSPVFVVKSLAVDGTPQPVQRADDTVLVDLGRQGPHTLDIATEARLATLAQHSQPPFLGAEGGFLAGDWLAQPDGRAATWKITGETPSGQKWLVPGELEAESDGEGRYTATFANTAPDELPVLITGPFQIAETRAKTAAGEVLVRTYFHAELTPLAQGYLDDAARYVDYYARTVGPFPYPGFAMVSGPVPVGIGLPGMTYMGRKVLALPFIRATSLPHEVLHNWWGNAVRIDYAGGNWAEGLTTYLADHAQAAGRDRDGGRGQRLEWLRNYAALPEARDQAVTAFRAKTHDASQVVGYGKVAYIFHMLKARLGADAFSRAVQRLYADNRGRTVGWAEVQAAFAAEGGENLNAFFAAWLERIGAPTLALEDVRADGNRLSFTVRQTQGGEAYPLTLTATVRTAAGAQRLRLDLTEPRKRFTVQLDGRPLELRVDPDLDVFRRLSANETPPIFRDVSLAPGTRLLAPGADAKAKALAHALAANLMQRPVEETAAPAQGPLILAGLAADVMAALDRHGLPRPPQSLDYTAQALAYVARGADGSPVLVAMAQDVSGLEALARVLAHYKRRSFAVMHSGQVTDKGVWPASPGPLTIRLDG